MELNILFVFKHQIYLSLIKFMVLLLNSELTVARTIAPEVSFQNGADSLTEDHVINDEDDSFKKPWQINKGLCPPILCPKTKNQLSFQRSYPFFEGDIVLDTELKNRLNWSRPEEVRRKRSSRKRRAIVKPISRRWPFGIVPYEIDPRLGNRTQLLLNLTFEHFHNYTCIRFRPKTDKDVDYLHYVYQPGCWSNVGRTGGRQLLSLGADCDQFGTIVHETAHALGFWHEQSRPDRDKYVKVIKKNIDPGSLEQFEKRFDNESGSHGYAYDYSSIMHYGDDYFTDKGQKTIKLIGIGKKLQFKIGQRRRLSDLDIAQLNDMYYCHRKESEKNNCREGWVKFRSSCYWFFDGDSFQFYPASKTCRAHNSRLVSIDNEEEDEFLKSHLKSRFSTVERWRTSGIRIAPSNEFVWYLPGSEGVHENITYAAWSDIKEVSKDKNSLVLARFNATHAVNENTATTVVHFEWTTEDVGSGRRPQDSKYPIICEAKAKPAKCFDNQLPRGRDYRGHLSYTSDAITCQRWTRRYPHNHTISLSREEGIGDHNLCRNPLGLRLRPWCFTLHKAVQWQYCDVSLCNRST